MKLPTTYRVFKSTNYLLIALLLVSTKAFEQGDTWSEQQQLSITVPARSSSIGFSINGKGYTGLGSTAYAGTYYKDFWQFDPSSNAWSQKADFGGTARFGSVAFSLGNKGYVGTGYDGTFKKDFWEYDPVGNIWIQKADFGGTARHGAVAFVAGNKGFVGTGYAGALEKDFWQYDPLTDLWTRKADFGGTARFLAVGLSIGSKGYIGTGAESASSVSIVKKDFWQYDPTVDAWTQKADFGGIPRANAVGVSVENRGYLGTGTDGSYLKDFWEYNPSDNTWLRKSDFGGTGRENAIGFIITNSAYIGLGNEAGTFKYDLWKYTPAALIPLPLSFILFNGKCENGNLKLNWKTANEVNSQKFKIEQSADAKEWEGVGSLPASGDNNTENNYIFTVRGISQNAYFRIVEISLTGKSSYSSILKISCGNKEPLKIYPNPVITMATVSLTSASDAELMLRLYDGKGSLVLIKRLAIYAGSNSFALDMNNLSKGIYSAIMTWPDKTENMKLEKK